MCTTETTTAASPGHLRRRCARYIASSGINDCIKAGFASVSLADGVGGDQSIGTTWTKQAECAAKEMRDKIGITVRALMQGLQPGHIILPVSRTDRILASERRIADDRVEADTLPRKDLWELQRPMERPDRVFARLQCRTKWRDGINPTAGAEMALYEPSGIRPGA